ncbi:hypothetical protein C0991_009407 [Blastosporella zonata]|nr:hypothetical protein C0991_009407 [Blastosporella zonata]
MILSTTVPDTTAPAVTQSLTPSTSTSSSSIVATTTGTSVVPIKSKTSPVGAIIGVGRLEEVLGGEKATAPRQRDQLRTDLGSSNMGSEALLRHQVEIMSERILQLERQQRDLENYQGSQPPPGYSVTAERR